ncbi:MAG TPA: GNAT family N-acetyltransferase [Terriglobales bacterium]|nr:GNAT family N-acetyltransferase [Terriglobales bacterium]
MRIVVARSAQEMEQLRAPWEAMQGARGATLFQRFEWNLLAARILGEAPHVVFAERGSGAALIPAAVRGNCLTLLGGGLFDYRDVIATGDGAALRAAWSELASLKLPLRFRAVRGRPSHWDAAMLRAWSGAPGISRERTSAERFARQHARLARALRRLRAAGAELRRADGNAQALLRAIWEQKAAQFGGQRESAFCDPRTIEFLLAAARVSPCDVFFLAAGTQLVAALVAFRDGCVRRFYTTWFDLAWARMSPGSALVFEAARTSLAEGLDADLMTGEQPFKVRLATHSVPLFEVNATAAQVARPGGVDEAATIAA